MLSRIYIAGASSELERAREAMNWCQEMGLKVTQDWVQDVDHARYAGTTDRDLTLTTRRGLATNDLHGVLTADIFWLLVPEEGQASSGCWVELGYALGLPGNRLLMASGANVEGPLFTSLVPDRFVTDRLALETLGRLLDAQDDRDAQKRMSTRNQNPY